MPTLIHRSLETVKEETSPSQVNQTSPQETHLYTLIQLIASSIVFLIILASASLIGGIVCSIYVSPIFASLIIATILFSTAALAAYHWISRVVPDNWTNLLTSHFHRLSAATAANSFECFGNHLTIWQHKHNANIYLAIPRYSDEVSYSLFLPALYRATLLNNKNYLKFLVNPIHPQKQHIDFHSNPSSQAIYTSLSQHQRKLEKSIQPFFPTETRISPTNFATSMTKEEVARSPDFLIHTRGPMLSEFIGSQKEVRNKYYLRALLSYKNILQQAVGTQSLHTVAVPIFSFVYEKTDDFTIIDQTSAETLCLAALVQAMDTLAQTHPRKLLVLIQLATSN